MQKLNNRWPKERPQSKKHPPWLTKLNHKSLAEKAKLIHHLYNKSFEKKKRI